MNSIRQALMPVHQGIGMGVLALIFGALWAFYMATHHEQLHGAFEDAEAKALQVHMERQAASMKMEGMAIGHVHDHDMHSEHAHTAMPGAISQHSHSGSLARDAMQRLLRGHIHFMGIGLLTVLMLFLVAASGLKRRWKQLFGWTFGLGALLYPPAWILMGFRTVELGPQAAEASVLWLFGPAVGLLIGSLLALFGVMAVECIGLKGIRVFAWAFESGGAEACCGQLQGDSCGRQR